QAERAIAITPAVIRDGGVPESNGASRRKPSASGPERSCGSPPSAPPKKKPGRGGPGFSDDRKEGERGRERASGEVDVADHPHPHPAGLAGQIGDGNVLGVDDLD